MKQVIFAMKVRELTTDWNETSIGKIVKDKRSYVLTDLAGNVIKKSSSIDKIAHAGRQYAEQQGYIHSAHFG